MEMLYRHFSLFLVGLCACIVLCSCSDKGINPNGNDTKLLLVKGMIYPNSPAYSDSVDARLAYGLGLRMSPGGKYTLTAEQDSAGDDPLLYLEGANCCENGCKGIRDGIILRYDFSCKLNRPSFASVTLKNKNSDELVLGLRHVKLEGVGSYSGGISLNVIFTGRLDSTQDGILVDSLPRLIGATVQEILDVEVDTVYVSYAWEHPSQGHLFSNDIDFNVDSATTYYGLAESWNDEEKDRAFGIVLVNSFEKSRIGESMSFFGPQQSEKCIVGVAVKTNTGVLLTSSSISEVVTHEIGHYIGLRHTSLTLSDMQKYNDFSVFEDGLEDTEYCQTITPSCTEYLNIMYHSGSGREISAGQRALVQKNLTLIPH